MRNFTITLASLFFVVIGYAQAPVTGSVSSPANNAAVVDITKVLEIKEAVHDFGKIPFGKPAEFDVVIKNISKDSVKIDNVKAGCGCTTPKWQAGPYAPGETFKVTVGFNGYTEGRFEKSAEIFFNNGLTQQIRFSGEGYKVADNAAPANAGVQKMKGGGN